MIEFISRLPQGYQEVEYIESSGTQYIDTGYKPTSNNLRIACEFEYTADHSASSVFGSESSGKYSIVPWGAPEFYVGSSTQLLAQTTALNTKYALDAHANAGTLTVSLNGITNSASYSGSILTTVNIGIFCNIIAGVANQFCSMRLYAMSIYDNGELVRNFVPCYRNSDHTAGLYDLSNNVFYANAGSGIFAIGSNVGEIVITPGGVMPFAAALRRRMMGQIGLLPSGYTRVDYIQGTGSQYIDTGFVVNKSDNYALEIDGLFPSQAQTYQGCNGYMQFFVSSKYGISNESSISVGNRDTVRIAYANQTATLTVNGSQAESKSWASYSGANVKLGVLRMGDTNNGWFSGGAASGTIYGYKVWENSELVSECIPCIRNSDNVAGMYDIVRKQFIQNAGTGAFNVAESIQSEYTVTVSGYQNGYTAAATVGGNRVGIGSTVTVADGTSCTITIAPNMGRYCKVTLNGTMVLGKLITSGQQLVYTFSITNNAKIFFCLDNDYPTAQITM